MLNLTNQQSIYEPTQIISTIKCITVQNKNNQLQVSGLNIRV